MHIFCLSRLFSTLAGFFLLMHKKGIFVMRKQFVLTLMLKHCLLGVMLIICIPSKAQQGDSSNKAFQTVIAGKQYQKSSLYQKLWGKHYRREWTMPVKVNQFFLLSEGELHPYEAGEWRQTRTLNLRDAQGREYVMRSMELS